MSAPDGAAVRAKARELTEQYRRGGKDAAEAFRELVGLLLRLTVLRRDIPVTKYRRGDDTYLIGGPRETFEPMPLRGPGFLRVSIQVYVDREDRSFLKVSKALYQYQVDRGAAHWVFRYEYIRDPPDHHPCAHLHVRGRLEEQGSLPPKEPLERVHFPTERVSLEAVIRLLVDHFGISCATKPQVWRPVLYETEAAFRTIAHSPRNPRQASRGE